MKLSFVPPAMAFLSLPNRFRAAGFMILIAGLLAALGIAAVAADLDDIDAVGYRIASGRVFAVAPDEAPRRMQELERIGGKGEVWIHQFDHWLRSLRHGRRLACTLLLGSVALALLCFHIAGLLDGDPAEVAPRPRLDGGGPAANASKPRQCRGARLHRGAHQGATRARLVRLRR